MSLHSLRFAPLALLTTLGLAGAFAACSTTRDASFQPCDDPGPVLIRGKDTGFEFCTGTLPVHRPKIVDCAAFERTPGKCGGIGMFQGPNECDTNADCAKFAPRDVCFAAPGNVSCSCAPSCVEDADCGPGSLCQCGDPLSFCRKALCRTDADCDGGALCVLSEIETCGVLGFACETPEDECLSSLDCPDRIECLYITDHRVCSKKGCEG